MSIVVRSRAAGKRGTVAVAESLHLISNQEARRGI